MMNCGMLSLTTAERCRPFLNCDNPSPANYGCGRYGIGLDVGGGGGNENGEVVTTGLVLGGAYCGCCCWRYGETGAAGVAEIEGGSAGGSLVATAKWLDPIVRRASLSITRVLCTVICARLSATSFAARTRGESFGLTVISVMSALRICGTSAAQIAPVAIRANPTIVKVFRIIFTSRCNGRQVGRIPVKSCTVTLLLRRL